MKIKLCSVSIIDQAQSHKVLYGRVRICYEKRHTDGCRKIPNGCLS